MTSKDIVKKITRIFFSFLFIFLVSFFVLPADNASATIINYSASCTGVPFSEPCTSFTPNPSLLIDTSTISKIEVVDSGFDDCGEVIITPPSGASFTWRSGNVNSAVNPIFDCVSNTPSSIANGDKTAFFSEIGIYNISVNSMNWGGSISGFVDFEVTTNELFISAFPLLVTSNVITSVEFKVTADGVAVPNSVVDLTGGYVDSCTTNAAGVCSITVTATTNITATASSAGYTDGIVMVLITAPVPSCTPDDFYTEGLVPCGRIVDNLDTSWNESESCKICHVVPLTKNIIDYLVGIVGLISVLFIIIAGIISSTSMGSANTLNLAKMAVSKSLYGFIFVLIAWVIVNIGMVIFGFNDPLGDGSWEKVSCDLNTVPTFCGDGIVNGLEKCEPGVTPPLACSTTFSSGACANIPVSGTQTCNSCCDWDPCTADPPVAVGGSSSACSSTSPAMNDYACCELTGCGRDGCNCCGRSSGASVPGGYINIFTSPNCSGSCKLNQSILNPRNWIITTNHTTATFQCYQ